MKRYKNKVFFAVLLVVMQILSVVPVYAELLPARQEIRVGLMELYSGKETLTINNKQLGYGYCVNNSYLQEAVLESSYGFSFEPEMGCFVTETAVYGSYRAAKQAADFYQNYGVEARPGSIYQCTWKVYVGSGAKQTEAVKLQRSLENIFPGKKYEVSDDNLYRMKVEGSFGSIFVDVNECYAYPQFQPLTEYKNGVFCVDMGSRVYRGRIEIGRYGKNTLTAVNILPLEEYLYGVVPAEMPANWPEEALKAQAVCSRSYALVKAGYGGESNVKKGYKIVDTVSSQVYKGYLAESIKTNRAIDATKGKMVCYQNKVVPAYYFSTAGGKTESSKDVWAVELPYLKSVPAVEELNAARLVWQKSMTLEEIKAAVTKHGLSGDTVQDIEISLYTKNNRVSALNLSWEKRVSTLQGSTIRTILNLDSTKFKIVKKGDTPDEVTVLSAEGMFTGRISNMYVASAQGVAKASEAVEQYIVQSADDLWNYPKIVPENEGEYLFAGMGYGHGVGMSQYGAKTLAEAGYTYKEIIEYYFTGANVK